MGKIWTAFDRAQLITSAQVNIANALVICWHFNVVEIHKHKRIAFGPFCNVQYNGRFTFRIKHELVQWIHFQMQFPGDWRKIARINMELHGYSYWNGIHFVCWLIGLGSIHSKEHSRKFSKTNKLIFDHF